MGRPRKYATDEEGVGGRQGQDEEPHHHRSGAERAEINPRLQAKVETAASSDEKLAKLLDQ